MACNGLKRGSIHLFVHPKLSRRVLTARCARCSAQSGVSPARTIHAHTNRGRTVRCARAVRALCEKLAKTPPRLLKRGQCALYVMVG